MILEEGKDTGLMGIEGCWDTGLILLLCILAKLTPKEDKREVKAVDGYSQGVRTTSDITD